MGEKMSPQRKKQLKTLLLNKAKEELQKEAERKAAQKKEVLAERIISLPDMSGFDDEALKQLCREIHARIDKTDDTRYDIEAKVLKNTKEIEELNQKIFELRGKFKRPPLRRVRMSADQMLKALLGTKKTSMDLRGNLKAAGKH
jgi:alanyl-tRNA synthetase